jgi:hypothetical protein
LRLSGEEKENGGESEEGEEGGEEGGEPSEEPTGEAPEAPSADNSAPKEGENEEPPFGLG